MAAFVPLVGVAVGVNGWWCDDLSADASNVESWSETSSGVVSDLLSGRIVVEEVPAAGAGDGHEGFWEASVLFLEVGEGFVACFGVGDVDVEDEEAGFRSGGDADSVVVVGAREPFGYEFRICCGDVLPVGESRPFLPWSDWDDSPATVGVLECCREQRCHNNSSFG